MMQQLSLFDLMVTPPVPVKPPVAAKVKLSAWDIEQRDNRLARMAYRSSLPSDDAGILNRAWAELTGYDAAVRSADYDGMVGAANRLRAIGEHAFGMTTEEGERSGPPRGNERFDCLHAAWTWLMDSMKADDGAAPLFGQKGRFELEIAGCRVDFSYAGMFGICGGDARIIEWDKPFFSETGFRSFQVCPHDYVIAAAKVDCKSWIARVCTGQLTEGGKKKVTLTRAWPTYALQWRQSKEFADKYDRADVWAQWGPEKHAEHWANHDARQATALEQMAADGIDPDEVWRTRR
ncbi:hypothetical protein [Rhizobium leguminosarum]|uniref:hypothetical protein n=1 Tax=Rhizobium leguminosarum TaxID=384 RepID=UPI000518FAC0|nr:hypothetical protein [Rhizobium leguminosarum]